MRLAGGDPDLEQTSLHETLAFVVTFMERLQRVLSGTRSAWLASSASSSGIALASAATAAPAMGVQGAGRGGTGGGGSEAARGGAGVKLSLALLEEAKLWSAILLRLARKLPLWKVQAPRLALYLIEHIPVLVATLTEALTLWKVGSSGLVCDAGVCVCVCLCLCVSV